MQVGDLVKALIVEGRPSGIITKVERSTRWTALYHVLTEGSEIGSYPFRAHQLEVISAAS
jgi:hypothetical protein